MRLASTASCLLVCLPHSVSLFLTLSISLSLSVPHVCVMCIDLYLDLCQHIDLVLHYSGQLGPQQANRRRTTQRNATRRYGTLFA